MYDRYGGVGAVTPIAGHDSGDRVLAVEKLPGDVFDRDGDAVEQGINPAFRLRLRAPCCSRGLGKGASGRGRRMNNIWKSEPQTD